MFVVDRVVSVQVRPRRHTVSIARPHRTRVVVRRQTECVRMLTQAIDIRVRRQVGLHAQVLGLEDDGVRRRREQDLMRGRPVDREREWRGCVIEPDRGAMG